VYVVGINRQFQDLPSFLATLVLDESAAGLSYIAFQNKIASLGPDQMHLVFILLSISIHPLGMSTG
jgi:hypothetical protein